MQLQRVEFRSVPIRRKGWEYLNYNIWKNHIYVYAIAQNQL